MLRYNTRTYDSSGRERVCVYIYVRRKKIYIILHERETEVYRSRAVAINVCPVSHALARARVYVAVGGAARRV